MIHLPLQREEEGKKTLSIVPLYPGCIHKRFQLGERHFRNVYIKTFSQVFFIPSF